MKESVQSWVDQTKVSELAQQLLGNEPIAQEFLDEVSLVQNNTLAAKAIASLEQAQQVAQQSGALTAVPLSDQDHSAQPSEGDTIEKPLELKSLISREALSEKDYQYAGDLEILNEKLSSQWSHLGLCVIDADGDLLYDTMQKASWAFLAVSLIKQSQRSQREESTQEGHVQLRLSSASYLQLFEVLSDYGMIHVALVSQGPLSQQDKITIKELMLSQLCHKE